MAPPKPRGPFFEKGHLEKLHAHATASLSTKAPEVNASVKAATPIGPARKARAGGELQRSITTKVRKRKNGVAIVVTADAKNEQGNHYGVFAEARDGFMSNALAEAVVPHLEDAIVDFANQTNNSSGR